MIKKFLLAVVVVAIFASTARAQRKRLQPVIEGGGDLINDLDQSTVALHPATPYLEHSTMLLADIDLEQLNLEETESWLRKFTGGTKDDESVQMFQGLVESMRGAGTKRIYVTAATRTMIDGGPVVVLPCENTAVVKGLLMVLLQNTVEKPTLKGSPSGTSTPDQATNKVHVGDKIVVAGPAEAVDRVTSGEGVERPDLILPMKRGGLLDHTVVVVLPAESRDDLVALWPDELPQAAPIQLSPRSIVSDVERIVVSFRLPPDPLLVAHVETPDALAAGRIKEVIDELLSLAPDVRPMMEIDVNVSTVELSAPPEAFFRIAMAVTSSSRKRSSDVAAMNAMKQLGLAIHNYYGREKHLPPRCFTDRVGNPLLSARCALLPYIEQRALYNAMKLDQSWDSPANRQIAQTRVPLYCEEPDGSPKTRIRFPVYPGSLWHGDGKPKDFRDVIDGTSNTIAAILAPADAAIEWANPEPWVLSVDDPMSDVFGDRDSVAVVLLDGAAMVLRRSEMTNAKLKALLTIAGNETIEW